jgi:hypothetical protein
MRLSLVLAVLPPFRVGALVAHAATTVARRVGGVWPGTNLQRRAVPEPGWLAHAERAGVSVAARVRGGLIGRFRPTWGQE